MQHQVTPANNNTRQKYYVLVLFQSVQNSKIEKFVEDLTKPFTTIDYSALDAKIGPMYYL